MLFSVLKIEEKINLRLHTLQTINLAKSKICKVMYTHPKIKGEVSRNIKFLNSLQSNDIFRVNQSLQLDNRMNYSSHIIENNSPNVKESRNWRYDYSNDQRSNYNIMLGDYQPNSRNNMGKWKTDFHSEFSISKANNQLPSQNISSRYSNHRNANRNSSGDSSSKSNLFMLDESLRRLHERRNLNNMRKNIALAARLEIAEQINKKLKSQKREEEEARNIIELENLRIKEYKKLNPPK